VLNLPSDSDIHTAFKVLWIKTNNDLMSIEPTEDLLLPHFYPTFDEKGEPVARKCRFLSILLHSVSYLQQCYRTVYDPNDVRIW
jgi:hypothetical protein